MIIIIYLILEDYNHRNIFHLYKWAKIRILFCWCKSQFPYHSLAHCHKLGYLGQAICPYSSHERLDQYSSLGLYFIFIFSLIWSHCRDICILYHFRRRLRLLRSRALDLSLQSSPPVHLLPCCAHRSHRSSHFGAPPWRNRFWWWRSHTTRPSNF